MSALVVALRERGVPDRTASLAPSVIQFMDFVPLLYVLDHNDPKTCFFGRDGLWNLFSILSLPSYSLNSAALEIWLEQVRPYVATDDLLFYRLAYLSWYNQMVGPKFANVITQLLQESSQKGFRKLVVDHYSQKKKTKNQESLMEIPASVLQGNQVARAALHFEHFLAAFIMGYKVPTGRINELLQKFEPSSVSPFLCRRLLENLNHCDFMIALEASLALWKEEYWKTNHVSLYFPTRFLPANIQAKLWRNDQLGEYFEAAKRWQPGSDYPQTLQQYIGYEYHELEKKIAIEKDGFTYIDCCAEEEGITKFIRGRMVEFLWSKRRLPKFIPLFQEYNFMNTEWYRGRITGRLHDDLCIIKSEIKECGDANKCLDVLKKIFKDWNVPVILFASL